MGKAEIRGSQYAIRKIFSDYFAFTVPLYQRPYAWITKEAGELLEDLIEFMKDGDVSINDMPPYFPGQCCSNQGR